MIQPPAPGFKDHTYQFDLMLNCSNDQVWNWLNNPKTFTETQVWPYKVEFYSPDPENIPNGFHENVLTNHSGPFINFAGVITKIDTNYRDLQYFYGSYAFSFNLIRPYRLEFWTEEFDGTTKLTCAISSYVKPGIYAIWNRSQKLFWSRFKRWARKNTEK